MTNKKNHSFQTIEKEQLKGKFQNNPSHGNASSGKPLKNLSNDSIGKLKTTAEMDIIRNAQAANQQ